MLTVPRYLAWARRFYGTVAFDLATSGARTIKPAELGPVGPLDDDAGPERLRAAIARYHGVSAAEVVPTLGCSHALWLVYAAMLGPGDDVLVEEPTYEPLWSSAPSVGAHVTRFTRVASLGFTLDPARIEAAAGPRTRIIAVTNLHNPTGVRASDEILGEVARIAKSRGAYLLVDEVYAPFDDLCDDDAVWPGTSRRLADNVIAVGSLTKCYGVGPQRIGWVLAPPDVVARVEGAIVASAGLLPLEHANLACSVFARLPTLASRARAGLADKRAAVSTWFRGHPEISWSAPDSGLFGLAWFARRSEDLTARIEAGSARYGVIVAPGAFFGISNGFRLSWSTSAEALGEGLELLARVLE